MDRRATRGCPTTPGRSMKYFEPSLLRPGERVLQRIENFCPFHDGFAGLATATSSAAPCPGSSASRPCSSRTRSTSSCPGGDGFKPHQDQQAGWSAYADLFITAHGQHRLHHRRERLPRAVRRAAHARAASARNGSPSPTTTCGASGARPVPTRPGDAVFFDSYTPHASARISPPSAAACSTSRTTAVGRRPPRRATTPTSGRASRPTSSGSPTRTYTFRV